LQLCKFQINLLLFRDRHFNSPGKTVVNGNILGVRKAQVGDLIGVAKLIFKDFGQWHR
jgi:hypothetical protein